MAVGVYVILTPDESFKGFATLFSLTVLANGIFDLAFAISNRKLLKNWEWYAINGALKFSIGLSLLLKPEVTNSLLPYFIALYFMASSGATVAISFDLKSFYIDKWYVLLIFSILLFGLSILIMTEPGFAEQFMSIIIGIGFFMYGYIYILKSKKLKEIKRLNKKTIDELKKKVHIEFTSLKDRVIRNIKEPTKEDIKTQ